MQKIGFYRQKCRDVEKNGVGQHRFFAFLETGREVMEIERKSRKKTSARPVGLNREVNSEECVV
jgi:hypothetical protein